MVAQQDRVRKREKNGRSGLREKSIFLLLRDCVFHSILSPFFKPPCHHSSSDALTHTLHHTSTYVCCPLSFLGVRLSVHSFPYSIKQHNIMQSYKYHTQLHLKSSETFFPHMSEFFSEVLESFSKSPRCALLWAQTQIPWHPKASECRRKTHSFSCNSKQKQMV